MTLIPLFYDDKINDKFTLKLINIFSNIDLSSVKLYSRYSKKKKI